MKAIVNTSELSKELKKLSQVINTSTVIPILSSVKMVFEKEKVTLSATDLETTIVSQMKCECKSPFTIIVEHHDISDICNKLNEPVTIKEDDKIISIIADNSRFKLPKSGKEEDFPRIPEEEFLFTVDVDTDFFSALYCADVCKNPNDIMTNTNTACIDFKKDSITIVGTDAFVLYKKDIKVKSGQTIQSQVRPKFVQAVKDMKDSKISVGKKFVRVESDGISIITRVQDSKFVSYDLVIPEEVYYNLTVDRLDFISSITKASVMSNKATKMCVLNFSNGAVKITSEDASFEKQGEADMIAIHTVEIEAIGVSSKQLLNILSFFDQEEVQMSISGPNKSMYIRQVGDDSVFCLLQPLMLN